MENNYTCTSDFAVRGILRSVPKYQFKTETDYSGRISEFKLRRKEELERKILYGEFGDGLSDLFILSGITVTLQSVINEKSTSESEASSMSFSDRLRFISFFNWYFGTERKIQLTACSAVYNKLLSIS